MVEADGDQGEGQRDREILRLENALARKRLELGTIQAVARRVSNSRKLDEMPNTVLEAFQAELGFEHLMLLLVSPESDHLMVRASKGYGSEGIGALVRLGVGPIGVAALRRKVYFTSAMRAAARFTMRTAADWGGVENKSTEGPPIHGLADSQSLLVIPLVTAGVEDRPERLIGVVVAESRKIFAFTEDDRQLLETVGHIAATAFDNAFLHQERVALLEAYERFVPKELLSHLGKTSITEVRLGDHTEARMTVMFTDIRSFTTFSEEAGTVNTFAFLNDYLKVMAPIVRENQGFIDKYVGDSIMAIFPDTPDSALRGGIMMQHSLEKFNASRLAQGHPPIRIGIGLHTGDLMLGILGFDARMEGTVISDTVNVASRVESLSMQYGAALVITEETFAALENPRSFQVRFVDRVRVKGKSQPISLYEVLDALPVDVLAARKSTTATFGAGMEAYYGRRFADAVRFFGRVTERDKGDLVAGLFLERARVHECSGVEEDWSGIETLQEK